MPEVKDCEDRLITLRRAKVAEMLAKGYNQSEIAKACVTSEPTISRDVQYLRGQATATMDDYLNDLPLQHAKARTACDLVLKFAFELMDDKANDQRLEAAKLILNATEIRVGFLGDVTALSTSLKKADAMKKQITDLKKKNNKPAARYDMIVTEAPASSKEGRTVKRELVKKEHTNPIV